MNIKQLNHRSINAFSLMISGLLMVGIGIIFLSQKATLVFAMKGVMTILVIFFSVSALSHLLRIILKTSKKNSVSASLFSASLNGVAAYFVAVHPELVVSLIPVFFGGYALIAAIIRLITYFQYKHNDVKGRVFVLISAIFLFGFSGLILSDLSAALLPISNLIGVFFLFYGLTILTDALNEGMSPSAKNSFKRRFRVSLPVVMVALIPHSILKKINSSLELEELDDEDFQTIKENIPYDLEVLVHVAEKGTSAFGHVDIAFEGKVLTYGAYDPDTYILKGAIADGVLIEIENKDDYIRFSQQHLNKTLFGFGLKLDEAQKQRVKEKIDKIHSNLINWEPKSQAAKTSNILSKEVFDDYASEVFNHLKSSFYKFKKGPFKTYFVLNTNCVLLADNIVGQSGIDAVKVYGLITPGTYFDFLNREFSRKNSIVIARTVYHPNQSILDNSKEVLEKE